MTMIPNVPENAATDAAWRRLVRDAANALIRRVTDVGTTAERPERPNTGQMRFNKTLGKPEWFDGTNWITWVL